MICLTYIQSVVQIFFSFKKHRGLFLFLFCLYEALTAATSDSVMSGMHGIDT